MTSDFVLKKDQQATSLFLILFKYERRVLSENI